MRLLIGVLLTALLLSACRQPPHSGGMEPADSREAAEVMEFSGTVVFVPLEGGFYGIVDEAGRRFDPVNLPADLQRDGAKVRVRARLLRERAGVHMWGTLVEIVDVEAQ